MNLIMITDEDNEKNAPLENETTETVILHLLLKVVIVHFMKAVKAQMDRISGLNVHGI